MKPKPSLTHCRVPATLHPALLPVMLEMFCMFESFVFSGLKFLTRNCSQHVFDTLKMALKWAFPCLISWDTNNISFMCVRVCVKNPLTLKMMCTFAGALGIRHSFLFFYFKMVTIQLFQFKETGNLEGF